MILSLRESRQMSMKDPEEIANEREGGYSFPVHARAAGRIIIMPAMPDFRIEIEATAVVEGGPEFS